MTTVDMSAGGRLGFSGSKERPEIGLILNMWKNLNPTGVH